MYRGDRLESRFAMIRSIRHRETGEIVRHSEYERVYAAIGRAARRLATVETIWEAGPAWDAGGKGSRMTTRAAESSRRGKRYVNVPSS